MRSSSHLMSLLCAAVLGVVPAIASAQPVILPPGAQGHVRHGPGPGGPGPGPGFHPGPGPGHHRGGGIDPGAAAAIGIIGLTAGAIAAGAASRPSEEEVDSADEENFHVRRCLRAYRSYDPQTDTYVDRNGRERRCRL